ncbi:MAG: phosphatase PAP2 family protein, partial [Planctomycetota bacterium]
MSLPFSELQSLLVAALVLTAALWHYRHEAAFRVPLEATLILLLYGGFYSILMYVCGTFGARLIDPELMRLDAMMGIHLPSIVEWAREHYQIGRALEIAYASVALQTGLVIIFRKNPYPFLKRFILGSMACLLCFILCPAAGPFASYGYPPNEAQATYLAHLEGLRSGWMFICCRNAQGLITVPSFHV